MDIQRKLTIYEAMESFMTDVSPEQSVEINEGIVRSPSDLRRRQSSGRSTPNHSDSGSEQDARAHEEINPYDHIDIELLSNRLLQRTAAYDVFQNSESLPEDENKISAGDTDSSRLPSANSHSSDVVHEWDTDDDSLPRIFEIFGGHYTNFKIDLRRLFLNVRGISMSFEKEDDAGASVSVYDYVLNGDWRHRPNAVDGVNYLQSRDLRRLDFDYTPGEEPTVLIRRHAVLISLDPWRVVVMADRVIGFLPDGADGLMKALYIQMGVWDSVASKPPRPRSYASNSSFEIQAYEAIFGTAIEIRKQEESNIRDRIDVVTQIMKKYSIVPFEVQEKMRQYKNKVTEMLEKVGACRHILVELLEDDESMALMNLTVLKEHPQFYRPPLCADILETHEDMEVILDSYLMDCNALISRLKISLSKLENAEDMVSLRLDTSRNQLLITNTTISVVSALFAMGGFVGSIWGMNLPNSLNRQSGVFWIVTGVTVFAMLLIGYLVIEYMKYYEIIPTRGIRFSKAELRKL